MNNNNKGTGAPPVDHKRDGTVNPYSSQAEKDVQENLEDNHLFLIFNELQEIINPLIDIRDAIKKQNEVLKANLKRGNFQEGTD